MDFMIAMEEGYNGDHNGADLKPWIVMAVVQLLNAGLNILFKMILNNSCLLLPVLTYRNIVAALSTAPFALYYEREMMEDWTWKELLRMIVCTFLTTFFEVSLTLLGFYYGMRRTTASYSSNIMNMTPIIIFILPALLRIENLNFGRRAGKLKVLGTLICVGGAILSMIKHPRENNFRGTGFLLCASLANAIGQILQEKLLKSTPPKYWMMTWMYLFGSLQTAVIGVFVNTVMEDWTLKWNLQLLTIFYSGFLNTAATYLMISWVIPKRGYIFPSKSISFSVFVTAIVDFLMGEHNSCGSLLGMIIIIGGLQVYLWTKDNEKQEEQEDIQRHMCADCRRRRRVCTCPSCGHRHRVCTCPSCGHRHNVPESRELEDIPELSQVDESPSGEDIPELSQVDESAFTEDISEIN